ncbi:MAG: hypothetical protein ACI9VR_000976 [Cognaticolwellia sp.]|jgi:hypothetical protein
MEGMVEALIVFAIFGAVFGSPVAAIAVVLRHRRQMKELDIRQIEAQTKLVQIQAQGELPEYIDREDPYAVAAYRRAREETLGASAKHAAASQMGKQL